MELEKGTKITVKAIIDGRKGSGYRIPLQCVFGLILSSLLLGVYWGVWSMRGDEKC